MDLCELSPALQREALEWGHATDITTAVDLFIPAKLDLRRTCAITESGLFRLARRDAAIAAVEIKLAGGWGRLLILDGLGDWKYFMPSLFTGSFAFSPPGFCDEGLIVHADCGIGSPPLITIVWLEKDRLLGMPGNSQLSGNVAQFKRAKR